MTSFASLVTGFLLFAVATAAPASIAEPFNPLPTALHTASRQSTCTNSGPCRIDDTDCMDRLSLQYANEFRASQGVAPLKQGTKNQLANAVWYSGVLRSRGGLKHQDIGSVQVGCGTRIAGENIAQNHCDADPARKCINAWINSPGHRANLLRSTFDSVSVGIVFGPGTKIWCTQTFGVNTNFESTGGCAPVGGANTNAAQVPASAPADNTAPTDSANPCAHFVRPELTHRGYNWMVRSVGGQCRYCIVNTSRCASAAGSARANAAFMSRQ